MFGLAFSIKLKYLSENNVCLIKNICMFTQKLIDTFYAIIYNLLRF